MSNLLSATVHICQPDLSSRFKLKAAVHVVHARKQQQQQTLKCRCCSQSAQTLAKVHCDEGSYRKRGEGGGNVMKKETGRMVHQPP